MALRAPTLPAQISAISWSGFQDLWQWFEKPRAAVDSSDWGPRQEVDDLRIRTGAPEVTRPLVRTSEEAREVAEGIASGWTPGGSSRYFAKYPGVGGTTAFTRRSLTGLSRMAAGFECGVAVLALPRRDLVDEKAKDAREWALAEGLGVDVEVLLGRHADESSGWWCRAEDLEQRATRYRELNRSACVGCDLREECWEMPGAYLFEKNRVIKRIQAAVNRRERPLLIVTTHAMLPTLWGDLPSEAPLVVDEAGELFGLTSEVQVEWGELSASLEHVEEWILEQESSGSSIVIQRKEWDSWLGKADVRRRATDELARDLKRAVSQNEALDKARDWARKCVLPAWEADQLVQESWPDCERVTNGAREILRDRDSMPPLLVADLVRKVTRLLLASIVRRPRTDRPQIKRSDLEQLSWGGRRQGHLLRRAIKRLEPLYQQAVLEGRIRPPRTKHGPGSWPWEIIRPSDGEDLRPAFTRFAVDIAQETLLNEAPLIRRERRKLRIWMPDHKFIDRARKGWVVWIAVGPMPSQICDALGVEQERVYADPEGLQIAVLGLRGKKGKWRTFGPGERFSWLKGKRRACASEEDEATRDLVSKLAARQEAGVLAFQGQPVSSFAAVLHKADYGTLDKPSWCAYFGAGHASTNKFAGAEMLLVRRWIPSFQECVLGSEAIRRALRLPIPRGNCGKVGIEVRRWWGGAEDIYTARLEDPLELELQLHIEMQAMLNAIGRCRPLSAGPGGRVVILLNGRPLEGVRVTHGPYSLDSAWPRDLLGIEVKIPSLELRRSRAVARAEEADARAVERQGRILEALWRPNGRKAPSVRKLSADLGIPSTTLHRDLRELGQLVSASGGEEPGSRGLHDLIEGLRAVQASHSDTPPGEVSALSQGSQYITRGPLGQSGHFSPIAHQPLPERVLELLPTAAQVHEQLRTAGWRKSERSTRRALADLKRGLSGDFEALVPTRSDKRAQMCRVALACLELLGADQCPYVPNSRLLIADPSGEFVQEIPLDPAGDPSDGLPPAPWIGAGLDEALVDSLEERAAILEFEGELDRAEAERRTWEQFQAQDAEVDRG